MRSRLLIIAIAIVLGATAALATFKYLDTVRKEAEAGSRMVEVLVAKQDIAPGKYADQMVSEGLVERTQIPERYIADGAISSVRTVAERILAVPVSKGEMLTASRFKYPTEAGLAFNVPADFVAVTIPVDEARGVASLVKPNDRVVVLATIGQRGEGDQTRIMISGAQVLAVGRSTGVESDADQQPQGGGGLGASGGSRTTPVNTSLTLAVSPADAEKVVLAVEAGRIWVALLPATQSSAAKGAGQTADTILK